MGCYGMVLLWMWHESFLYAKETKIFWGAVESEKNIYLNKHPRTIHSQTTLFDKT